MSFEVVLSNKMSIWYPIQGVYSPKHFGAVLGSTSVAAI